MDEHVEYNLCGTIKVTTIARLLKGKSTRVAITSVGIKSYTETFCWYRARAVARTLIGGVVGVGGWWVFIHIFMFCPTSFFSN